MKVSGKTGTRASKVTFLAATVALGVSLLAASGVGDRGERGTYGLRFAVRGSRSTHSRIVIAALDSATEAAWRDEPLVFWTGHYAHLIRNARAAGAIVVAFDLIPEVSGQRYIETIAGRQATRGFNPDGEFEEAIEDAGPDALVFADQYQATSSGKDAPTIHDAAAEGQRGSMLPDILPARQFLALPEVSGNLGFTDVPTLSDDVLYEGYLRLPAADVGALPLPSFPALIASRALEAQARKAGVSRRTRRRGMGVFATSTSLIGDASIPTFYINYTGELSPQISAVDLANGTPLTSERGDQRALLKGAIVLVGRTVAGGDDIHRVPHGEFLPGVEVQAQAVATLLDDRPLRRLPPWGEAAVTLLYGLAAVAVLSPYAAGRWTQARLARELPLLGALLALALGAPFLFFSYADFLFPLVGPILAVALPFVAAMGVRAVEERRQREYIHRLFGKHLALGNYLIDHPEALRLGGTVCEAAVLFFDIRDSTDKEEKDRPEAVIDWLNDLFRQLVPIVEQTYPGHVYRYTGDGFLAVFGAPVPIECPAKVALDAAIAIVRTARGFHWPDGQPVTVGCAINYGSMAAGNIGTENRPEWTVIGNVVNVAAKIESLNKATVDSAAANVVVTQAAMEAAGLTPNMLPGRLCRAFTTTVGVEQAVPVYCIDVTAITDASVSVPRK